ncbi:DUF5994 family protein [Mycobacterium sp. WMMD1722]|uniref:DUF5994 family protein n=1 Tax=Mycobacterium sp. WMMD1722 TaxID=3404117 RepID=UPI003BF50E5B
MASTLGSGLDGAWWPYTASVGRELPYLVEALTGRLGEVVDISVNWSSLEGTPDLNSLPARGALPGQKVRQKRVITVTGKDACANLLVIPSGTSRALAVMILRQAASLPVEYRLQDSTAWRAASVIVDTARAECARRATPKSGNASLLLD